MLRGLIIGKYQHLPVKRGGGCETEEQAKGGKLRKKNGARKVKA
jgi:hypothetical protein